MRQQRDIDSEWPADWPAQRHSGGEQHSLDTVIIGGGQAGLAVGYHLARRGQRFVILDAHARVGDSWRSRWDSLRLFTPAKFSSLPGWRFPATGWSFPSRDEFADYLEQYAQRFDLPVRPGVVVEHVHRRGDEYVVTAGEQRFVARNIVLATGAYQEARVPEMAVELAPGVVQLHSSVYRDPSQLQDGSVLVVGAGNSGADIALEAAANGHTTYLAGRDVGQLPFRMSGAAARLILARLVLRVAFHRVLTVSTPMGRAMRKLVLSRGGPLIRVRREDFADAGIERVPRVAGVQDGRPVLDDGRVLDVANVVWCTGFRHDYSWIGGPGLDVLSNGGPPPARGVVREQPGLYVVGLHFVYAMSSPMIHGVGRDAAYIARQIAARGAADRRPVAERVAA